MKSHAHAVVPGDLIVAIKECRAVIGRDQQILIAVAVEIRTGKAASNFWAVEAAVDRGSNIGELAAAVV